MNKSAKKEFCIGRAVLYVGVASIFSRHNGEFKSWPLISIDALSTSKFWAISLTGPVFFIALGVKK